MKLRFNKEARKSLAETLKVLSYLGPAGATLLFSSAVDSDGTPIVATMEAGTLFVIYCVIFIFFQVLAIGLVAYEDDVQSGQG